MIPAAISGPQRFYNVAIKAFITKNENKHHKFKNVKQSNYYFVTPNNKDVTSQQENVRGESVSEEHRSYNVCKRCIVPVPFKVDVDVSSSSHFATLLPRRQRDEATCNREAEALHINSSTTLT